MARTVPTIAAARRAMDRASSDMAKALEAFALRRLRIIAARNPGKVCSFFSAMGTWSFQVGEGFEGQRDDAPTDKAFGEALQEWGWAAIPAPVKFTISGGKVTRITNW